MPNWWDGSSGERYWCEVTDRADMGSDLKAPQTNEAGQDYWSYSLIKAVAAGDIVFHYSTRQKAFAGASVAGGPMEERAIVWAPHGTVGRTKDVVRQARPGFWRPLYGYRSATTPLPLSLIDTEWLKGWMGARRHLEPLRVPFQLRVDGLRAGQGYLFKMPSDVVERLTPLRELADVLEERAEALAACISVDSLLPHPDVAGFRPKSEADYTAVISASVQHRTRTHERLVRVAGQWLQAHGAIIANAHPKDLELIAPVRVIIEAKVLRGREALFAAREALGQLHEYRYFIGPSEAELALLLDAEPPAALIRYLEDHLEVAVLWLTPTGLRGGLRAQRLIFEALGPPAPQHALAGLDEAAGGA